MTTKPRIPTERKRLLGNLGHCPLSEPVLELRAASEADLETMPVHLGDAGRGLWANVWSEAGSWLSPDSDLPLVVAAREMADLVERARMRLKITETPQYTRAYTNLNGQLISMLSMLGFTPSDRSRLGVSVLQRRVG